METISPFRDIAELGLSEYARSQTLVRAQPLNENEDDIPLAGQSQCFQGFEGFSVTIPLS
jgi:hypothetical protein